MSTTMDNALAFHNKRIGYLNTVLNHPGRQPNQATRVVAQKLMKHHTERIQEILESNDKIQLFDDYNEVKRSLDIQRTAFVGPEFEERFD